MRARYICAVHFGQSGRAVIGAFSSVYSEKVICNSSSYRRSATELSATDACRSLSVILFSTKLLTCSKLTTSKLELHLHSISTATTQRFQQVIHRTALALKTLRCRFLHPYDMVRKIDTGRASDAPGAAPERTRQGIAGRKAQKRDGYHGSPLPVLATFLTNRGHFP